MYIGSLLIDSDRPLTLPERLAHRRARGGAQAPGIAPFATNSLSAANPKAVALTKIGHDKRSLAAHPFRVGLHFRQRSADIGREIYFVDVNSALLTWSYASSPARALVDTQPPSTLISAPVM
jgi:hypothetical protein